MEVVREALTALGTEVVGSDQCCSGEVEKLEGPRCAERKLEAR